VTFYGNDNDLPSFEDYSMSNRTYRYFKGEALYPFGFGLSYATFRYSGLHLTKNTIAKDQSARADITVTNSGKYKGDEVVQLYIIHEGVSYAPLQALKGFKRITLAPGQSQKISFTLTPELLRLIDEKGMSVFTPGKVKIIIGGSSPSKRNQLLGISQTEAVLTLE
jgi:beta-glucosidase